jgi:fructoselysine-6-P-deglycase FrlB-like protein
VAPGRGRGHARAQVDEAHRAVLAARGELTGARDALAEGRAAAEALGSASRLLAVGSGLDAITASELALKVEEAAYVPTTPLGAEKVLHGHLPAADASTGVVFLRFDTSFAAARDARVDDVAAAVAVLGMPTARLWPAAPVTSVAAALLSGALALQLFTLELAHVHGTNPDLIRREQDPYRAAAEAGAVG